MRRRRRSAGSGSRITFSGTFPANPSPGQRGLAPKYPLVESLPTPVVDEQSWRIAEVGRDYGREYLGRSVITPSGMDWALVDPLALPLLNVKTNSKYLIRAKVKYNGDGSESAIFALGQGVNKFTLRRSISGRWQVVAYGPWESTYETKCSVELAVIADKWTDLQVLLENGIVYFSNGFETVSQALTGTYEFADTTFATIGFQGSPAGLSIASIHVEFNDSVILDYRCDDPIGATVIKDYSGNNFDAIVTDGSPIGFLSPAWVPQDSVTNTIWQWQPPKWVDLTP